MNEAGKMTLDEAIKHCLEVAEEHTKYNSFGGFESCDECAKEHRQLAKWLTELKELREIQKAKAMLLDYSYTLDIMCNKLSGTIGCEKCTYYNPETHDCEVRAYITKTRAFVKKEEIK